MERNMALQPVGRVVGIDGMICRIQIVTKWIKGVTNFDIMAWKWCTNGECGTLTLEIL